MLIDVLKKTWPEWQVEGEPLGRGSFGTVFKAVRRNHNVESRAAIKVIAIPADSAEIDSLQADGLDPDATRTYLQNLVNDFVSEIQLMERLKGVQNIVSVEDYEVIEKNGELGWYILIRMELLTPFNKYALSKTLTEADVIKLGCDICTALELCQSCDIIHRDIKPENIFINDFGHYKLGDFGIARKMGNISGGLSQKGTFNYMAPEVANSNNYDTRADLYSLGIVLYKLLNNNRLPFLETEQQLLNPNERRLAVERRIQGEPLPAPSEASPAMASVILTACNHDCKRRFASAAAMKRALEQIAYSQAGSTPWPTKIPHTLPAEPATKPDPMPEKKAEAKPEGKGPAVPKGGSFFRSAGSLGSPASLGTPATEKKKERPRFSWEEKEEPVSPKNPVVSDTSHTPISTTDDLDGTVRVRRAPPAAEPRSGAIPSFGKKHK